MERPNRAAGPPPALSLIALVLALTGCERAAPLAHRSTGARRAVTNESAYHAAPRVESVADAGGRIIVVGRARPGVSVRLAAPDGRAAVVTASPAGLWRIVLPASSDMRLFGLSMVDGGRVVQAEGYLAIAPDLSGQLRAGAGSLVYGAVTDTPQVLAVDFDSKGGCIVSGSSGSGRAVSVWIDGARRGAARASGDGRFMVALEEPVSPGRHTIEAVDGLRRGAVSVDLSAAARDGPPLRYARLEHGWRVDWRTPGGGLQSTLLFAPFAAGPEAAQT